MIKQNILQTTALAKIFNFRVVRLIENWSICVTHRERAKASDQHASTKHLLLNSILYIVGCVIWAAPPCSI